MESHQLTGVLHASSVLVRSHTGIPRLIRCSTLHSNGVEECLSFHQISRGTGERVRHQKVLESSVEKYTNGPAVPVEKDEIVKGYEYQKGQYVIIEPSELENLKVPSKHTIETTQFVEANELLPEYIEKPYFVVPEKDSVEAFTVIRKALLKTGRVAIGKVSFSGRENIVAVRAAGEGETGGMMAYTLRSANELRSSQEDFRDIKPAQVNGESPELAEGLIAKRSSKLDISKFEDGYEVAVKELVEAKLKHLPIPKDEGAQPSRDNVVNLMDALRKSIGGEETQEGKATKMPGNSVGSEAKKGIGLVKPATKAASKRKTA
jgi:DNA end-binding protein Ku